MSEWEDRRLGDCVQMLSGGTPSKANADYWNGHIPWVSAKDLKSFFLHDTQDHITQEAAQNGTKIAPKNSILILVRGMTLHNDLPIGCPTRDMAFNQDVKAIIADKNLIESKYLAYWLLANKLQLMGLVESASHGTGRINTDDLKSVVISYPALKEQKQISGLLGNFDRKIENLRIQNDTLEAIAQTLFKHWFVDFEFPNEDGKPYKSSGGEMMRSELREIPTSWRIGKLEDEFDILMGQSPDGSSYNEDEEGLAFFQGRTDFGFRFPQVRIFTTQPKRIANKFDTLVSVRAPVGDINVAFERCCIGRGLSAVSGKYKSYCLYKLKSYKKYFDVFETEGTVFGSLNKQNFNDLQSIIPSEKIIENFDSIVAPLDRKIFVNEQQIRTLTKTRDVLLPKLMSGQIRVGG